MSDHPAGGAPPAAVDGAPVHPPPAPTGNTPAAAPAGATPVATPVVLVAPTVEATTTVLPAQTVATVATAPALISSITVRRFKGIDNVTLPVGDSPCILVGANNSGKSSILHAAHFAVSVAQTTKLVGEGINWANDEFKLSFNPTQLIWSPVADAMSLAAGGILDEQANRQIEISLRDSAGSQAVITVRRGRNRNIQVALRGRPLGERLQNLEQPFSVLSPGVAGIAREERFLSPGVVRRAVARGDANLVLRNVLLMLQRDEGKWQVFCDDIRELFPGIEFDVRFNEETDETIGAFVRIGNGPELPLDAAGTAVLQAIQIVGYSALYNPPLVLLDEPDSHLHPNNQRALCRMLLRLSSERRFRVVMSTHSRHVMDALRTSSNVVWMSGGTIVPNAAATLTARLLDLGALDTVDFFADTQTKCVVITEDSDTSGLEALLWSAGFNEEDTRIASYDGCSKVEAATVLGQFIITHANAVTVVVHRDADFMSATEIQQYEQRLENCDMRAFVTEPSDVESYFLNPSHLAELNPGVTADQVAAMIDAVTLETRDQSIETIINIRVERANRNRPRTGQQPNVGQISVQAAADYDASPTTMRRGKIVLGRVVGRIQQAIGANPRVFASTTHLQSPKLADLASRIWGEDTRDGGAAEDG